MFRLRLRYCAAKRKQSENTDDAGRAGETKGAERQKEKKDYRVGLKIIAQK